MAAEFFEFLKSYPLVVLIIGSLCFIVAVLIYKLLKRDIVSVESKLSNDIANVEAKLSSDIAQLDIRLSKEIAQLDIKLSKEIAALRQEVSSVKELLLSRIIVIEKQLTNHVTDTDKKIDKLRGEVQELKAGQEALKEGHARLESKMDQLFDLLLKEKMEEKGKA